MRTSTSHVCYALEQYDARLSSRTIGGRAWPEDEDTIMVPDRGQQPFGVYVHVPFCRRRCDYCAFATWTDREHLWERYVAACRAEVGRLAGPASRRGPATSVFFGGGTPSLLPAELLVSIIRRCAKALGSSRARKLRSSATPRLFRRPSWPGTGRTG